MSSSDETTAEISVKALESEPSGRPRLDVKAGPGKTSDRPAGLRSGFGLRVQRARDRIQDAGDLVEDGGGRRDVLVAERGQTLGPQAVPDRELALEELPALRGQRDVADAPVLGATPALDDVRCLELIEDRSDGGRRQLGALGELAGGHLVLASEGRDRPDLREGQLARSAVVAATKPAIGGEQLVDRRAELFYLAGGFGDG